MKSLESRKGPADGRRADQLIVALLQHPTMEKAAGAAGLNPATVWRWMKNEDFREKYREARRQSFAQSLARLQHAASAAVTTLLKVMVDPQSPAHSRVRAADSVLSHSLWAMEMDDIEVRLARLEAQQPKS